MPKVGFEPTIIASERAKTVHALDRSPIVTGLGEIRPSQIQKSCSCSSKGAHAPQDSNLYNHRQEKLESHTGV
jgi:hypothetical protein